MRNMHAHRVHRTTGFTLLELAVVIVLTGIVAASVIPAVSSMTQTRGPAAAEAIARELGVARQHALNTGRPSAAHVDIAMSQIGLHELSPNGGNIQTMLDAFGQARPLLVLGDLFPGISLSNFEGFDGAFGAWMWFGSDGAPELRSTEGTLLGLATHDARLELAGGETIVVRRISGLIE
ncbi:MAG: prepilin-type N-terminal cleavage/methylation domain-containing protein [Phycisphaeraceae bacterium]|nr:prepilin-type N-terminal cleavage/methylation domain-containing protein [Phycisphaeraceae bacterium]